MSFYYRLGGRSLDQQQIIGMSRIVTERGWRRVTRLVTPRGCKLPTKRKVYVNDALPGVFCWSLVEAYRESERTRHVAWQNAGMLHRKCRRAHA